MKKLQIESNFNIQSITNVGIFHYPNVFGEGNILTQNKAIETITGNPLGH
jgi:hypothetical protein